jgi:OOP family OmpA-OmpF porin
MRTAARFLVAVILCTSTGCAVWKRSSPAPTKEQIVLHGIVDFDESAVRADSIGAIQEAADMLKEHGNLGVVVEGHTDSSGDATYNQKLSLQRAEAVRDYLMKFGVDKGRIVVIGKGASEPIASNETRAGRAQNRRVVLVIYQPKD